MWQKVHFTLILIDVDEDKGDGVFLVVVLLVLMMTRILLLMIIISVISMRLIEIIQYSFYLFYSNSLFLVPLIRVKINFKHGLTCSIPYFSYKS